MSYKILYEENWVTKGEKGNTRLQSISEGNVRRNGDIAIRITITKENEKYGAIMFFPSYKLLKETIIALVQQNGKEEIERELGVKVI